MKEKNGKITFCFVQGEKSKENSSIVTFEFENKEIFEQLEIIKNTMNNIGNHLEDSKVQEFYNNLLEINKLYDKEALTATKETLLRTFNKSYSIEKKQKQAKKTNFTNKI